MANKRRFRVNQLPLEKIPMIHVPLTFFVHWIVISRGCGSSAARALRRSSERFERTYVHRRAGVKGLWLFPIIWIVLLSRAAIKSNKKSPRGARQQGKFHGSSIMFDLPFFKKKEKKKKESFDVISSADYSRRARLNAPGERDSRRLPTRRNFDRWKIVWHGAKRFASSALSLSLFVVPRSRGDHRGGFSLSVNLTRGVPPAWGLLATREATAYLPPSPSPLTPQCIIRAGSRASNSPYRRLSWTTSREAGPRQDAAAGNNR